MAGEPSVPPRLQKGDSVRIVGVFTTGDVLGIVDDDDQLVVVGEDEPQAAKRQVSIDGEDLWPLLRIKQGAGVGIGELVVLINEGDLFPVQDGGGA